MTRHGIEPCSPGTLANTLPNWPMKYYWTLKSEKWYKHQPEPITDAKEASILWSVASRTNRKIKNRSDIMVKNSKRKASNWYINLNRWDNISLKEYNNIRKYKNLEKIQLKNPAHSSPSLHEIQKCIIIFTHPSARPGYDTGSIFLSRV